MSIGWPSRFAGSRIRRHVGTTLSCVLLCALLTLCMSSVLLAGCAKFDRVEITHREEVQQVAGSCVETVVPMFLVRRSRPRIESEELLRYLIVRPGRLFAPFSVAAYERGEAEPDELAEVVQVIPAGYRLEVESIWSLEGFEGDILSVSTTVQTDGIGEISVDMTSLLDVTWALDLADGRISEFEEAELRGRTVFDPEYGRSCRSE